MIRLKDRIHDEVYRNLVILGCLEATDSATKFKQATIDGQTQNARSAMMQDNLTKMGDVLEALRENR